MSRTNELHIKYSLSRFSPNIACVALERPLN